MTPRFLAGVMVAGVLGTSCGNPSSFPTTSAKPQAAAAAPAARPAPLILPAEAIASAIASVAAGRTRGPVDRGQLESLYAVPQSLWLDTDGRPTAGARDALALLAASAEHGLVPDDYQAAELQRQAHTLAEPAAQSEARALFEVSLSRQVLRYWRDLHMGRVDPRTVGFRMNAPVDDHDFAAMLREAVRADRLREDSDALAPPLVLYRAIKAALVTYRALAAAGGTLALDTPAPSFKPGAEVGSLPALHARLVALGDLPAGPPPTTAVYDSPLVDGVKRFQRRHGLEADGVMGKSTVAALMVPLATRVRQLELALERLRWLPHLDEHGFLAVNLPMFHLWGWHAAPAEGPPALDMEVIVGRALNTRTPVFVERMRHLIFRPYWNVPRSILRGEILPAIARDPSYLDRQDMEIVLGQSDQATPVAMSEESLAGLREGRYRVRQRPGPKNALGLVKFVFPNDDNIYMHGTPAPQLFGRARRDFSHGCVRVWDPVALAVWLLRDQPQWTRARIVEAMEGRGPQQVTLTRPLQVILFYLTAAVMPGDGAVRFADDIYGHDARLVEALGHR